MSASLPTLISPEKLRTLTLHALDILYECQELDPFDFGEEEYERGSRQLGAAIEAVRFCARVAALHKDTSLLPLLVKAIKSLEWYNGDGYNALHHLSQGLRALLRCATSSPPEVRSLMRHEEPGVRAALAAGLQPRGEEELEILEALASDPIAEVRSAAQRSLSSVREIPWWRGKFSQDPAACLSATEALALKPTFEEISRVLDTSSFFDKEGEKLATLAKLLPDALLFDLAKTCLSGCDLARLDRLRPFLAQVLRRGGGGALLCDLLVCWSEHRGGRHTPWLISRTLSELPVETRVSVCQDLLGLIVSVDPPEARAAYLQNHYPYQNATDAVRQAWPAEIPPEPVLAALASLPEIEETFDSPAHRLGDVFGRKDIDLSPFFDEMIEAYLSRDKGRFRRIPFVLEKALDRAPPQKLRPAAKRALASENDALVAWGLLQLTGPLHDPAEDPSPPLLLKGFFEKPRHREIIYQRFHDLGARALPLLRAELRAKTLGFSQAAQAMLAIDLVHGGLANVLRIREDEKEEEYRRELRDTLNAFLGPEELRGPPTEEEWRRYRAARDAYPFQGAWKEEALLWHDALRIFPKDRFSPEDRAFLARAVERWRADGLHTDLSIALALAVDPLPEYLPLLDELTARSDRTDEDMFEEARSRAAEKLGHVAAPQAVAAPPGEWMDEEEDEA